MNQTLASVLAAALVLLASVPSVSAQTDPVSVLQQLVAAVNRNDEAAQVDAFTDDAIVIGGPCHDIPGGACLGKAMIQQAVHNNPARLMLPGTPQVVGEGNVVTFRFQERFDLPPQAVAAGVGRFVEVGTAVVNGGKIARLGLVPDVTDPQTMTALRVFSTLGPPPGAPASALVASDGQSLATQPASVAQQFASVWGSQAPSRWVQEHEAALHGGGR